MELLSVANKAQSYPEDRGQYVLVLVTLGYKCNVEGI